MTLPRGMPVPPRRIRLPLALCASLALAPAASAEQPPAARPAAPAPAPAKPVKPVAPPAQKAFVPMDPQVAIDKANAYLTSAVTMIADFVQMAGDGRRAEGKLYVQKPGRLRFEYAEPATLDIISDGLQVAIRDRKLKTQDIYFVSQTPLKFLLKDKIDLARDVKILDVTSDPNAVTILVEDSVTFGGTSRIKLVFDPVKFALKQWQVTDPQGNETLVSLFNVDLDKQPDLALFKIPRPGLFGGSN